MFLRSLKVTFSEINVNDDDETIASDEENETTNRHKE